MCNCEPNRYVALPLSWEDSKQYIKHQSITYSVLGRGKWERGRMSREWGPQWGVCVCVCVSVCVFGEGCNFDQGCKRGYDILVM